MIILNLVLSTSLMGLVILLWNFVINRWKKYGCSSSCITESSGIVAGPQVSPATESTEEEDTGSSKCSGSSTSGRDSLTSDTPLSSTPGSPRSGTSALSRRQKKNRKRDKDDAKNKKPSASPALSRNNSDDKCGAGGSVSSVSSATAPQPLSRSKKRSSVCKQYDKLSMADHQIYNYFSSYTLSQDQLRQLGFPQDSSLYPGKAYIYKDPEFCLNLQDGVNNDLDDGDPADPRLDANAQPFVPTDNSFHNKHRARVKWYDSDSDSSGAARTPERKSSVEEISSISLNATAKEFVPSTSSISSSISCPIITYAANANSKNSTSYNTPLIITSNTFTSSDQKQCDIDNSVNNNNVCERVCVRCSKMFSMQSGEYQEAEQCHYHWGKLRSKANLWTCCQARPGSRGCSTSSRHVWSGLPSTSGIIGPLQGYVKTKHRKSYPNNGNFGIYGIDCEMCYTKSGLELAKVTVVGVDGRLVYESLVCPENDIIDFNTRYSGISAKDFVTGQFKNIKEVQNDLMGFINADTILVGHGLENDLRALNLIHATILDTAVVFPHYHGLPFRRSLRSLVSSYLKRDIQVSNWGHDSYEDARACVELMLWKTRKDLASRKSTENSLSNS